MVNKENNNHNNHNWQEKIDKSVEKSISLQDAYSAYLQYISQLRLLNDATVCAYMTDIQSFFSHTGTYNFSSEDTIYRGIRKYIAHLTQQQKSASTINRILSALRGFFRYLTRMHILKRSPMSDISNVKKNRTLPRVLFTPELKKILALSQNNFFAIRNNAIMEILYSTGMRVHELLSITIYDVVQSDGAIFIQGKNNRYRHVFMGGKAREAIARYLDEREKLLKGKKLPDQEKLFINSKGEILTVRGVQWLVNNIARNRRLAKSVSPHAFRHSFATHMLERGANIRVVQELLGHKRLSTTQIYTHLNVQRLQKVCEKTHPHAKKGGEEKNDQD